MPDARKSKVRASTPSAKEIVAQRLEQRRAARALTRGEKLNIANSHKERGNAHFRDGEYEAAIQCYEEAIEAYGPKAAYMNNLSAALLKVGIWDHAATAASWALHRDPKLVKARYRRGLARKEMGNLVSALYDFQTVLKLDPDCKEAQDAIDAMGGPDVTDNGLIRVSPELNFPEPEYPLSEAETPVPSDSEDYRHRGDGKPCRAYNHDGCKIGSDCNNNHGPDKKSVRDELGRNVCMAYIASACPLPASLCPYAHDKSFVNAPKFRNPSRLSTWHQFLTKAGPRVVPDLLEVQYLMLRGPMEPREYIPRIRHELSDISTNDMLELMASLSGKLEDRQRAEWMEKMRTGKGKEDVPEEFRKRYESLLGPHYAKKRRGGAK